MTSDANKASDPELAALCRRLKESDRAAFERLFRRFREELLRYAYGIVRDGQVAQDLIQDVFVDLWGRRERLDPALPLTPYLYRMTRNRAYRHLRDERSHAEKRRLMSGQPFAAASPSSAVDAQSLTRRIHSWIGELPERQREALLLSRLHALSHDEVATVMGISSRTVNNHIVRALKHLRARIHDYEPLLLES